MRTDAPTAYLHSLESGPQTLPAAKRFQGVMDHQSWNVRLARTLFSIFECCRWKMKDVFGTATIIASIAIAIALMLMVPKGLEADPGPIISSVSAGSQ